MTNVEYVYANVGALLVSEPDVSSIEYVHENVGALLIPDSDGVEYAHKNVIVAPVFRGWGVPL